MEARIPASLAQALDAKLALARSERVAQRLADGDATLWGAPDVPEVANRLGWLTIALRMLDELPELQEFAAAATADGLRDVVLLGMGGSSLAPAVLRRCFGDAPGAGPMRLHVLDSTDAATILEVQGAIELDATLFLVSSSPAARSSRCRCSRTSGR